MKRKMGYIGNNPQYFLFYPGCVEVTEPTHMSKLKPKRGPL